MNVQTHDLEQISDIHMLCDIAIETARSIPNPTGMVCGPMSSGGTGDLETNMRIFGTIIRKLTQEKLHIFDQIPFEPALRSITRANACYLKQPVLLLEQFYLPLFESGYIQQLYFIPGWKHSPGAKWEHVQGERLGLEIHYLPDSIIKNNRSQ